MKLNRIIDDGLTKTKGSRSTGLIHPNGNVLETDFFMHITEAKKHLEFLNDSLRTMVLEFNEILNEVEEECHALGNNGDHPEWHRYEMAESDLNSKFMNELYKAGYLRYYIHFKNEVGQTFGKKQIYANVTLEGFKIENHYTLISYLKNKYRVHLKVEHRNKNTL